MAVAALGLVLHFERPYSRWLIWTSSRSLAGGLAASLVGVRTDSVGLLIAAVIAAAATEAVVDMAIGVGVYVIRRHGTFANHLRSLGPVFIITVPLYAPLLVLLVYAYSAVSPWSVLLFSGRHSPPSASTAFTKRSVRRRSSWAS